ncbi:amine oxidase [Elysia marginata]|uniref:Amine oxidase n=1 Tax=Elysia marginata TaxID=1093978 RepID=A0AAV4GIG0_9GAST|nr:amine oxidase [Elysia marginata]
METISNVRMQVSMTDKMWVECDTSVSVDDCAVFKQYLNSTFGACVSKEKQKETVAPVVAPSMNTPTGNADRHLTQTNYANATVSYTSDTNTQLNTSTATTYADFDQDMEDDNDLPPHTPVATICERMHTPSPLHKQAVRESTTQVTPHRTKPSLVDCASSPIFKQDYLPKPSPDIATPLTETEERQHTNFITRKLAQSKTNIITCKTGGQPISVMKITSNRKSTAKASASTKRKRSQEIETAREMVAGTSKQALHTQQTDELNRLSKPVRREVFKDTGLECTVHIDEQKSLAMKVNVGLTYSQQRGMRHVLKGCGVTIANERAERKAASELIGNDVTVTEMLFTTDEDVVEKPMVRLTNISEKLTKLLESQRESLTWHDGAIPENEVWVKVGGDHGQGSMKFNLAIVNTKNPNSRDNVLIGMANIKDSSENMEIFFEPVRKQLDEVTKLVWDGKTIKLFLFGDYDFLCKMYGIAGANGSYPCLWCLTFKVRNQREHYHASLMTISVS